MTVTPLGDSAVVLAIDDAISADTTARVRAIAAEIEHRPPAGAVDVVPVFGRIAVFFEKSPPVPFDALVLEFQSIAARADAVTVSLEAHTVEIPVRYGGEHGVDLELVANRKRKSVSEVIELHAG